MNKWHLFLSQHPCLNPSASGEIYSKRRGMPNFAYSLGFAHVSQQLSPSSPSSERWFDGKWFRISNMCGPYWVLQCCRTGTERPSYSLSSRPWLKTTSSSVTRIGGPCHPRSSQTMFVRYHSMCLAVNEGYSSTTSLLACNLCMTMV